MTVAGLCFTDADGVAFGQSGRLVALSYLIAACGSYVALDMAERLRSTTGVKSDLWLAGSAATLGGSIWSMHFIGLLSLRVPLRIGYDPIATAASLVIAVAVVAIGLHIARAGRGRWWPLCAAGLVLGLGVAAMHYVGMQALLFSGRVAYHPRLWAVSVAIAIVAAIAALWLSMTLVRIWHRAAAALVMAAAICGMHYTGMASTEFLVNLGTPTPAGVAAAPLAVAVAACTFVLLVLALVSIAADRRLFAAASHEAEALRQANSELEATQREIVRRLCSAGEFRDSDTGEHVDRIAQMAYRLALAAGCDAEYAECLLEAAPLHDIGKIGISDGVLLKPGKLSPQEWVEMRRHAEIGHKILSGSGLKLLDLAAEIARSHHEKWDGTGYPLGLAGAAIPLGSRIVAIVDVFDALLSERPYKPAWPFERVAEHIAEQSGRHFDPQLVRVFLGQLEIMRGIRNGHARPDPPMPALIAEPGQRRAG